MPGIDESRTFHPLRIAVPTVSDTRTAFHHASFGTVGLATLQSRALAGQIEETFVFGLPGSTGACRDGWDLVLGPALDRRYRPCSFAERVPRLRPLFE